MKGAKKRAHGNPVCVAAEGIKGVGAWVSAILAAAVTQTSMHV